MERVINGVTCIKGEIHSVLTLIRLNTRWSQVGRSSSSSSSHDTIGIEKEKEIPFVQSFRRLNEYLECIFDLREVDCVMYIQPFHEVIVSDQANGPLTSAALSSLSKFALYGFLSSGFPRVKEGIALIANCISYCVFEETDWESDEVILMKLLELSALCLRCDASSLLTVGAAWDIYSTCIEIHNQYRASKILKSEAETALRHLTLTAFSRAHYAIKDQPFLLEINSNGEVKNESNLNYSDNIRYEWDSMNQQIIFSGPIGITMLLSKIMTVLGSLMDLQKQTVNEVNFALSLINIALEAGGPALGSMKPLVDMLRGDICRHLLRATQSEDLAVFSLALRVVFNLFMSIKDHMKIQLEVFLTSVHLRLLMKNQVMSISPAKEELALESLLEFCREPALMQDLYTNYDCDVQCTNLFDSIITTLCNRAIPFGVRVLEIHAIKGEIESNRQDNNPTSSQVNGNEYGKINNLNRLALDGVFAVLHAVASRCNSFSHESNDMLPLTAENVANIQTLNSKIVHNNNNEVKIQSPVPLRRLSDSAMNLATPPPVDELLELQVDRWCMTSDAGSQDSRGSPIPDSSFDQNDNISRTEEHSVSNPAMRLESRFSSSDNLDSNKQLRTVEDDDPDFVLLARARTAEVLRQRKLKKQRLKLAAEKFNEKPLKNEWIRFSVELGLIQQASSMSEAIIAKKNESDPLPLVDSKSVAKFLKITPGLGKTQIGEFLSKGPPDMYPFNAEVLKAYVDTFEFKEKNSHFDKALRLFLGHFRLPGEAQCIDRLMEAFANKLFDNLGPGKPFASADAAFILSFSTIMLNTDLHNPQIPHNKRMTKEEFLRNNRGINDGQDLPREYLEFLYDEIKSRQIQVDMSINDTENSTDLTADFTDMATWNKLLRKSAADQAPAAFTPTVAARKVGQSLYMSANEKDMFLVMANPYLRMLLTIWENANDDNIMRRIIEGFWDYATICKGLKLYDLLSRMIQIVSKRMIDVLSNARKPFRLATKAHNSISLMKVQIRHLEEEGIAHNFMSLVTDDFLALISSKWTPDSKQSNLINWNGAHIIRGELMLKTIMYACSKYTQCINEDSWKSIFQLLLWVRDRGLLSEKLASISDIESMDSSFKPIKLPLTVFGQGCQNKARGITEMTDNRQKGSWWSWLSSNDNKPTQNGNNDNETNENDFNGNCSMFKFKRDENNGYREDIYLERCMIACKLENIIFNEDLEDAIIVPIVTALLRQLHEVLLSILSSSKQNKFTQNENESFHRQDDDKSFESPELNAVMLLEWLCNLSFVSKGKPDLVWPRIHDFFRSIFEENIDKLYIVFPYFIERCIVKILQAANQLATEDFSLNSNIEMGRKNPFLLQTALTPSTQDKLSAIWSSLRLMRGVPSEILYHVSDRIGLGVLSLLKNSKRADAIESLEQWYMIFSLLSAATCGPSGRQFVWEATCLLIDNNLLNDINFTPCRHLLLRFLFGVFPGDEDFDSSLQEKPSPLTNPWLMASMTRLMILTSMAMAGYVSAEFGNNKMKEKSLNVPRSPTTKGEFITFPLPSGSRQKHLTPSAPRNAINEESSQHLTVLSVKFARPHEVEMLWIESCKNFADLVNVPSSDISQKATYCIHAILMSGGIVGLPKDCWFKVLQEMLNRLPLNIQDLLQQRNGSEMEMIHRCLSSCNIVFEMLVGHIKELRDIPDFPSIWLRFTKVLSTNLSSVQRDHPLYDEMLEMIAALLRLLRPPALPAQQIPMNVVASPQPTPSLGILSFISPLIGYETPAQPKITQQQVTSFLMNDNKNLDTSNVNESLSTPTRGIVSEKNFINGNNDAALLKLSWKNLCTQCPSLSSSLRTKNPQLVLDLQRYMEVSDTLPVQNSDIDPANKNINKIMRKVDSRTQIV